MSALRVTRFSVAGFRNLHGVQLAPDPRANLFLGANGQGKTSLLEAIDYVATLRSFRGANRAQLIGHDAARAEAAMRVETDPLASPAGQRASEGHGLDASEVDDDDAPPPFAPPPPPPPPPSPSPAPGASLPHEFRVMLDRKSREISLDGKRPERAVAYYGAAACVVFHPQDLDLVRGAPEVRRRLLDRILVRVVDGYGEALRSYARALKSRNAVLRDRQPDPRAVAAYDPALARLGSAIVRARREIATELLPAARQAVTEIALTEQEVTIAYRTRAPADVNDYLAMMRESLALDIARKATSTGPHADDVAILWGRRQARAVTSQGQTRALALALRLAELHVLEQRSGRVPWLLLDDVSSELDRERTERLFALVAALGAQVWVTTTDPAVRALLPHARVFTVRDGTVAEGCVEGP